MLDLSQLLRVPHVDNGLRFDISPDGQRALFAWNRTGAWEIFELSIASPPPKEDARILSQGQGAKFSPQYSPDGLAFAYAADFDGSESYHIFIWSFSDKKGMDLTPYSDYAQQPNFSWSPDGKTLAILSDEAGQFALYLLSIETREKKLLLDVHRPIWDAVWSPDGKYIAAEAESTASDRTIYIVDVNSKEARQLKLNDAILNAQHPAWSPDSKLLAFSGENGEWHDIGLFNIETKKITWVNESVGDDSQPVWSRDGSRIGWVHAEGASSSLQVKERSGGVKEYKIGAGVHCFPRFASNDIIVLYEDASHPCDLWKIHLEDDSIQQLTNSLPDELRGAEFIQPEEVWYAGRDGAQIPALLYRAKHSERAVINIHGGPNWHYQFLWNPVMSHMASRGWTVLAPNYRGSTGYGKKWQNASRYDMGGVDTDDCAAGVKYLLDNGLAHKNKIAVTGRSHGGFLTMSCMTRYPELWAGGSAVVPFLNWFKSHTESREDLQHWNIENMGDPETNGELWRSHSPYFFLDKVNAPAQMICGENDPRCPASDSMDARDTLVSLGKEVEFLLYKGEGHSFLDINNIIDSEVKRMEFLAKVLK